MSAANMAAQELIYPLLDPPDVETLTELTMERVISYFNTETEHRPSLSMYRALAGIARTMAEMAVGQPDQTVYLSSLDPGIGKTTVLTAFVDALLSDHSLSDVGVLILVSRLDEVRSLIHRIGIPANMLSVITSDPQLNACGQAPTNKAQVLITTQQGLERKMQRNSFNDCAALYYQGRPRPVRIWDETWLPGEGVTLRRYDLTDILRSLVSISRHFADAVEDMFIDIKRLPDQTRYDVPNWEEAFGVTLNEVVALFDDPLHNQDAQQKEKLRSIATHLFIISGKTVVIRQDGHEGNAAVTYRETLPLDLMPLVVLDASGRVRSTYTMMERKRQNITRLPQAVKRYDPLTVHLWQKAGGKNAFRQPERAQEIIQGIANTVNAKPSEQWLIVVHKPSRDVPDVEARVRELLSPTVDQDGVHFITWGNHAATNAYADVPNVILAGTLFFRPSQYEALGRLAAQHPDGDYYPEQDRRAIEAGEHAHGILQALCRAAVRQCRGAQCAPCDAYVIASVRSGIGNQVEGIFPGCRIERWAPVDAKLTGKVKQAVEYLRNRFNDSECAFVKFKEVQNHIGIAKNQNFRKDIRLHPDFMDAVAGLGLTEYGARKYHTEFRRNDGSLYGFTSE